MTQIPNNNPVINKPVMQPIVNKKFKFKNSSLIIWLSTLLIIFIMMLTIRHKNYIISEQQITINNAAECIQLREYKDTIKQQTWEIQNNQRLIEQTKWEQVKVMNKLLKDNWIVLTE